MPVHYNENSERIVADMLTGEITEHTKSTAKRTVKREELYYMIMFHMGGKVMTKGLPRSCDYVLDMISADCMPWKDGDIKAMCVIVGDAVFQSWADKSEGEYKKATVKRRFMQMVGKDIFRRVQRGLYMVNPHYAFKGNLKDIEKARERYDSLPKAGLEKEDKEA